MLELYDTHVKDFLPELQTGTFDLSTAPNDTYTSCQHCMTVITPSYNEIPQRTFFQTEGKLTLSMLDPLDWTRVQGKLTDVRLIEVEQKEGFVWEPVKGGDCYTVPEWSFDTTPLEGIPCEKAEDCGNTRQQVCSPTTKTCVPYECWMTDPETCPSGQTCFTQAVGEDNAGACYTLCTPGASGECDQGSDCIPLDPTQSYGRCMVRGKVEAGAPCSESDVSTGCQSGSICAGHPARCEVICDYLTPNPGCPAGRLCTAGNICLPPEAGDPAPLHKACGPSWAGANNCDPGNGTFEGFCFSVLYEPATCEQLCRLADPACPAGQFCNAILTSPDVGLCREVPVCGDGKLDVFNETCDDGNTVSGDGCSGNCAEAELDVLCTKAEPLSLDTTVTGTTVGGVTGYWSSCNLYRTHSKTYSLEVPGPGQLAVTVKGAKNFTVHILEDCKSLDSELGCSAGSGEPFTHEQTFAQKPGEPIMIVVSGSREDDLGPFEISASFTPTVCGDGNIVGAEECDDGNTTNGDGCSSDCLVEWPLICAGLPTLSTSAPNMGDTTSSPNWNNTGFWCTDDTTGNEIMYRFVAPKDGKLNLRVAQPTHDFAIYVIDGCGLADGVNILECGSASSPPNGVEEIHVPLTSGQLITVVVDAETASQNGPFVLDATFE
ncbi:Multiple EGF-like-domain protein 3 precursor [Minicystis rosea]|nr:Multiple EGF-like-domain protein 3 precursor [Minicystis rosea]